MRVRSWLATADMEPEAGGQVVGSASLVTDGEWQTLSFDVDSSITINDLRVTLDSVGGSSLGSDWVQIDGETYQAEGPEVLQYGYYGGPCSLTDYQQVDVLHCDGFFDFADVTPTGGGTTTTTQATTTTTQASTTTTQATTTTTQSTTTTTTPPVPVSVTIVDEVVRSQSGRITEHDTAGAVWDYAYDQAGRLDTATRDGVTWDYGYDANSNRTSLAVTGQPTLSYAYSATDRLTTYTGGGSVGYDSHGNTTSIDGITLGGTQLIGT